MIFNSLENIVIVSQNLRSQFTLGYFNNVKSTVTANWLKSQNGTLFSHVWRRGRLALDPLQK